jgi:hypothetical protein
MFLSGERVAPKEKAHWLALQVVQLVLKLLGYFLFLRPSRSRLFGWHADSLGLLIVVLAIVVVMVVVIVVVRKEGRSRFSHSKFDKPVKKITFLFLNIRILNIHIYNMNGLLL